MKPERAHETPTPEWQSKWLRYEEVATCIGVARSAVEKLADEGKLERVRFSRRHVRISAESVTKYIAKLRAEQAQQPTRSA